MTRTSVSFDINKVNWSNSNIFPDYTYADTNSILDIALNRRYGQETEDYVTELVSNHNGMLTWSQHTIEEITQVIHVNEYVKLAKTKNIKGKKAWKEAENTASDLESTSIGNTVVTRVDSIINYLEQFGDQTEVDESEVNFLARYIYSNYGVNLPDAKHIAIANLSGVNNILTQDAGFLRFPNINIYGASKEIVKNYQPGQNSTPYVDLSKLLQINSTTQNGSGSGNAS